MSGTAPPPAGGQDQSMDDILASIRRILNEDEASAQAAEVAEAAQPEAPAAEEPEAPPPPRPPTPEFAPPPIAPSPPPPAARSGPEPLDLTSDMLVSPPNHAASAPRMGMDDVSGLIAPAAAAAAAASVGSLLRAVSSERGSQVLSLIHI
jgi:cell pole-organizing protein PopZ